MQVELPVDHDRSWRNTLSEWQRERLACVGRGTYNDWREHHRLTIVVTDYGFDIVGLARAPVVDGAGAPITDAWLVVWVDECHGDFTSCLGSSKYAPAELTPRRMGDRSARYEARKRWGWHYARTLVRRRRRARRAERRKAERDAADRKAYEEGLAEHVRQGLNPLTYVHDEEERVRKIGQGYRERFMDAAYGPVREEEGDDA